MKANYYAVVMAGGGGTRLWPVSTKNHPKQFLRLADSRSLFRIAIDRLSNTFAPKNIKIVTVKEQVERLIEEVDSLSSKNFLIEPFPRGTAAVVGFAASVLNKIDPNSIMAVLTADHLIKNETLFQELLEQAYDLADSGYLVTLGIKPTYAATGYGYIKGGKEINSFSAKRVEEFKEKPDFDTAQAYLKTGKYYWNSGMFIWRSDEILKEFKRQMPRLFGQLEKLIKYFGGEKFYEHLPGIWQDIQPQTIDYGIMENAENVIVLPAENLGWNDVGFWDSLYGFMPHDQNGNIGSDKYSQFINSNQNLVFSENKDKIIALLGMDDTIVVDTGKALLICKKGQSQNVRELIEMLKKNGFGRYL